MNDQVDIVVQSPGIQVASQNTQETIIVNGKPLIIIVGLQGIPGVGSVQSVRGLNTDNTDPNNPIVKISVDGTTITGAGTPASPLVGAAGTYSGSSPSTITVGGLPAGSNISNQTFTQLFQEILVPYISPSFASFTMSGQASPIEVGATISGSKSFTFSFNTSANVAANTLEIRDATTNTSLASGLPITSPESANVGSISLNAPGSHSWQGRATNTNSVVFNSSSFTVNWQWRAYFGTSANVNLNASQIQALVTANLSVGFAGTYHFVAGDYKYFCWPDSFGSPAVGNGFKDSGSGFALGMATVANDAFFSNVQNGWYYGIVSVTNTNGVVENYRVYRTVNILNDPLIAIVS